MEDREMLELAAKAAGRKITGKYEESRGFLVDCGDASYYWNPLLFNSNCAEMEAELDIDVRWGRYVYSTDGSEEQIGVICGDNHGILNAVEPYGDDKQAARRRASTRVAAMIGKDMP